MSTRQPGKWAGLPVRNTLQLILLNSSVKYGYICEKRGKVTLEMTVAKLTKKKKIVIVEYGCALNGNISQKAKIFKIEEKGTK